jgi:prepilin peptidase CpaA
MEPEMLVDSLELILFPSIMAFAASSDLLTMTISNRVSIILVAGFFVLAVLSGMPPMIVLAHVGAASLVLVVSFGLFTRGWIGGGDAKLAAATALWLGFNLLLKYLLYASLFGGVLTVVLIEFRALPLPGPFVAQPWAQRLHRQGGAVPYGIALAAAGLAVYLDTPWMKSIGF